MCVLSAGRGEEKLMVPQVAGWDGSDDPDFRCEGCGQTSTVPRLDAEDDELLMHKTSMGGFDVVTPALERMSPGPCTPTTASSSTRSSPPGSPFTVTSSTAGRRSPTVRRSLVAILMRI